MIEWLLRMAAFLCCGGVAMTGCVCLMVLMGGPLATPIDIAPFAKMGLLAYLAAAILAAVYLSWLTIRASP